MLPNKHTSAESSAVVDWADMNGTDHFVQFYDSEPDIIAAVGGFFVHGLRYGETCIMAATSEHTAVVQERIRSAGIKLDEALASERFISLDAQETLDKFMVDGRPREDRFDKVIGQLARDAANRKKPIRIFGEMVAVLMAQGRASAALELETLWNDLAGRTEFRLFCAYQATSDAARHASSICSAHSKTIGDPRSIAHGRCSTI
jgi:hypothetical protein